MSAMIVAIAILIFVIVYKSIQKSRQDSLRKQVDWVTSTNDGWDSPRDMAIWKYVYNAQIEKSIPPKYRITKAEDWDLVRVAIHECSDNVSRDYLSQRIEPSSEYYALSPQDFFFAMFYHHLYMNMGKYNRFCDRDMYEHTESFTNEFGRDSKRCFLSDAGTVYYKLCYITSVYCKSNPRINCGKTGVWITGQDDYYKKVLDQNYVEE